ncbi:MAG TPA: IclR family transcriptional regulator [Clostridiaceae bacterium]|nr:IclR family transcriptional regulator [Clostridiaceae bacterium]
MHKPTERVLNILLLLASEENLNLSDISAMTKIPKSTLSPILSTLVDREFIYKRIDHTYRIGINSHIVGKAYTSNSTVLEIIEKNMENIVSECNEICQLGVLREDKVYYIAKKDPNQAIQLISHVGKFLPAYSTSLGKILLSYKTNDEIKSIIGKNMKKMTNNTITDIDHLIHEIEDVRKNKYALDNAETSEEIECMAVSIEKDKQIIAGMSVSLPIYRSTTEKLKKLKEILFKYKDKIEQELVNLESASIF